jgi:hypothetical protein
MLTAAVASFEVIEATLKISIAVFSHQGAAPATNGRCRRRDKSEDVVFHAQIATDLTGNNVRIVTMYLPET